MRESETADDRPKDMYEQGLCRPDVFNQRMMNPIKEGATKPPDKHNSRRDRRRPLLRWAGWLSGCTAPDVKPATPSGICDSRSCTIVGMALTEALFRVVFPLILPRMVLLATLFPF